ncbi:MAG: helicase-related protein [bacterium]
MRYQGKEVEVINKKTIFGKEVAEIKIISTSQIISVPFIELETNTENISVNEIIYKVIATKIKSEILNQKILSPFESNVIPLPHQILALEKIMSGNYLRFLLADEVGMGKTIETGLALKELKLRGIVKRSLIIVGKTAMLQWQQELKHHFNEIFHIYDTEYINALVKTFTRFEADNEINIWGQHNQLIVSLDALKPIEYRQGWSKQKVEEYNKYRIESVLEADFDLVVIDECHKVGGGTQLVGRFQMAEILCNAIPNILLLSATPHRGKSDHFRRILQLLDADAFSGEGMPPLSELEPYVIRTEKRQAIDYNGKPLFNKRITKKIDVVYDNTKHLRQQKLYDAVTEYVVTGFNLAQQTKNNSYGFVMLLFQRMMSSSTKAILDAMKKRVERLSEAKNEITKENTINNLEEFGFEGQYEIDFEQKVISYVTETRANYDSELIVLQGLIRQAIDCINMESDAKVDFLLEMLVELKKQEQNPDVKILLFTEFTSTQAMLKKDLEEKGGFICDVINGSMDFDARIAALKNFKNNAQILIATDAAGESLNMQFAYIVINYDMPWNPMILEQRIGRVDRIGQSHEVLALNIMLDNSIEKRVYEVIETKLNQIMNELGIDKTADVLDSTMERDGINRLYLTSLLNPAEFEKESKNWLQEIKKKLSEYKSTEGALPSLNTSEITVEKVESLKHSPIPNWLEDLTKNFLKYKNIPYLHQWNGVKFKFPGFAENIYTFNIKDSINDPIPEPVSLQHPIIQSILSEAVPFNITHCIPIVKINNKKNVSGYWSVWHLCVKNEFEAEHLFQPIFISNEGDVFLAFAQDIWSKLIQDENYLEIIGVLKKEENKIVFTRLSQKAEELLQNRYIEIEQRINDNTNKIKANKQKAFDFREKQIKKIGIENIKKSRLNRLSKEKEEWLQNFDSSKQTVPVLNCLIICKVQNE